MYLKYDNMHTNVIINAVICINNHVNSCTNSMLSRVSVGIHAHTCAREGSKYRGGEDGGRWRR